MSRCLPLFLAIAALVGIGPASVLAAEDGSPLYSRHVIAVFSRTGCNGGTCHGAVKGQNGFRLTLFGGNPALDHDRLLHEFGGRRVNSLQPEASLLLLKATAQVPHQGGKRMDVGSPDYEVLRRWIAGGASADEPEKSRVAQLRITPAEQTVKPGETYRLRVEAKFIDGSVEDITPLCSFESTDRQVATVLPSGEVQATGIGDAALIVRYRAEPAMSIVVVPRPGVAAFQLPAAHNFIDKHILAKLQRLNIPSSPLCDDATFLRRVSLDLAGELPAPKEVHSFLADTDPEKRNKKIDELLARPGYAALWTLKFCDLLKGSEFGVYADGLKQEADAPRFQQWVRARLQENIPYDQFVERVLTATSREGRSLEDWAKELVAMQEGYAPGRKDCALYSQRQTLDLYWERGAAAGVPGTLQIAHAFLGLRLECAQCHRHPHDIWQQDDLLSFANFFTRVRKPGFQGDNEKKFPESAAMNKKFGEEAKKLTEEAKKLRDSEFKKLEADAKQAKTDADKLSKEIPRLEKEAEQLATELKRKRAEIEQKPDDEKLEREAKDLEHKKAATAREDLEKQRQLAEKSKTTQADFDKMKQQLAEMDRRSKMLPEIGTRLLHAEIANLPASNVFASVTSPLGTQSSKLFRLLGEAQSIDVPMDQDPRALVVAWMRRPDNPYFARAIVNRVWAHYFGRGIVDPPDNLSPFNPASHPELLKELCDGFIQHGYDLKWLHRTIAQSRTYQQSSLAVADNEADRRNYAYFAYRRLPAEVLLDALNQATGTSEKMDMQFQHWPAEMKTVEIPFAPKNSFVNFMLEHFGRPKRNSAVQCDCERDANASVLQVLSFANHPRVWAKIADKDGQAARIFKEISDDRQRIDEVFLCTLARLPDDSERQACSQYLKDAESPQKGLQGILWSLLNTREFLLQH